MPLFQKPSQRIPRQISKTHYCYVLTVFLAMYTFALQWNANITKYNYENAVV